MSSHTAPIPIYVEVGTKRTFAGPLGWPGWCRSGKDEASAIQALLDYGPRYANIFAGTTVDFIAPEDVSAFEVVERLVGNGTTDMGACNIAPEYDRDKPSAAEFDRSRIIIRATWRAFDRAVEAARGKELTKGPRGGGRDLDKMIDHVVSADGGYLRHLAHKANAPADLPLDERTAITRAAIMTALDAAEHGDIPKTGPRGGKMWTPRYYVRRSTWHTLDHAWELEDRIIA